MEYKKGEWKVREQLNLGYLILVEAGDTTKELDSHIAMVMLGIQNE